MAARPTALRPHRGAAGYAYLALLFAVVLIGAGLGGAAQVWHTTMQRERERQLLWVGHAYRNAIRLYWQGNGGAQGAAGALQPAITVAGPSGTQTAVGGQTDVSGAPTDPSGAAVRNGSGAAVTNAAGQPIGVPTGPTRYPPTLDALLTDPRFQQIRRYLRQLYPDPMTGKNDWVPILAPNGGVMGVRSVSEDEPFKKAGFAPEDINFTDKLKYSDWQFVYVPPQRGVGVLHQAPAPAPNYGPAPGLVVPNPTPAQ